MSSTPSNMSSDSPSSRPFGFAIVGTGMIAGFHARAIAATPGAQLLGLVSRTPERAKGFALDHGVEHLASTVEEMARHPAIDAVIVTTPSGAHLDPALAVIQAGKHVVIEKPIETTPERADQILTAAAAKDVQVAVIFQGRFGEGAGKVKAALEAGRLGRIVLASAYVKWHRTARYYETPWKGRWDLDGGGALMNQAIHGVDLLQWFAGLPLDVSARMTRRVHTSIEADDTTVAVLRFPNGALGTIEATTAVWPGWSRRIEICGEHGSICLEDDRIVRWEISKEEPGDETLRHTPEANALGSGAGDPAAISIVGHQRQIQDFVEAVRENRPPMIDGEEGRKAVSLVDAIYRSAKEGGHPTSLR